MANDFITNRYTHYYNQDEKQLKGINIRKMTEMMTHMIEVVDSLFIEPAKSMFITHIPEFATIVSESPLWENLIRIPDE